MKRIALILCLLVSGDALAQSWEGRCKADIAGCRAAAEQGEAVAQNNLGWMYEIGAGLPQDYAGAMRALGIGKLGQESLAGAEPESIGRLQGGCV